MFICEIWLFVWYFPQFCTSDMSKYGYLEVFQRVPFDFEITRVDCNFKLLFRMPIPLDNLRFRIQLPR